MPAWCRTMPFAILLATRLAGCLPRASLPESISPEKYSRSYPYSLEMMTGSLRTLTVSWCWPYLSYLIRVTIAPAFLCISIYICLARIIVIYGRNLSRFRPGFYTITFVGSDFFSLVLHAIGGALAATASTPDMGDTGVLAEVQGFSHRWAFFPDSSSLLWLMFLSDNLSFPPALATATILIFVRSIFRVAELQSGFDSELANDEVALMILEGAMMMLAVGLLTVIGRAY